MKHKNNKEKVIKTSYVAFISWLEYSPLFDTNWHDYISMPTNNLGATGPSMFDFIPVNVKNPNWHDYIYMPINNLAATGPNCIFPRF